MLPIRNHSESLGLPAKINAARDSIKHLLAVYGTARAFVLSTPPPSCRTACLCTASRPTILLAGAIPASVLGGNIAAYRKNDHASAYPGGSDTGIGWTYLRYPHAASTAWAGLLLLYQV